MTIASGAPLQRAGIAGDDIPKGSMVTLNASGRIVPGKSRYWFAADDYTEDDEMMFYEFSRGDHVNALLAVGQSVDAGETLEPLSDGTFKRSFNRGAGATAKALEALDNSQGAEPAVLTVQLF